MLEKKLMYAWQQRTQNTEQRGIKKAFRPFVDRLSSRLLSPPFFIDPLVHEGILGRIQYDCLLMFPPTDIRERKKVHLASSGEIIPIFGRCLCKQVAIPKV